MAWWWQDDQTSKPIAVSEFSRGAGSSGTSAFPRPAPVLVRLHGRAGSNLVWAQLPSPMSTFAVDAALTDDHMSALLLWTGFGTMVVGSTSLMVGPTEALVMATLVVVVPIGLARRWTGRRTRQVVAALPNLVDMVGRSLRSGASLTQSLSEAAADSPPALAHEFDAVLAGIGRGQPAAQALRSWADRVPHVEVRIVAAALALASRNEAGTSQALDGVSQSLRDRASLRLEIRSQTAQAAASMQALVVLPLAFLCFDAIGSGQTIRFLTTESRGRVCLMLAVVLDVAGGIWISSMVRRRSPS